MSKGSFAFCNIAVYDGEQTEVERVIKSLFSLAIIPVSLVDIIEVIEYGTDIIENSRRLGILKGLKVMLDTFLKVSPVIGYKAKKGMYVLKEKGIVVRFCSFQRSVGIVNGNCMLVGEIVQTGKSEVLKLRSRRFCVLFQGFKLFLVRSISTYSFLKISRSCV